MIRYTLKCAEGHGFDSWFQSADAYEALADRGMVSCAICGGTDVTKALMAPRVSVAESAPAEPPAAPAVPDRPLSAPAHPAEQMLRALREHLQKSSTYVGGRFAQEARAMHLGEADERPIHGEASPAEARALIEEGVPIAPLPILPPDKTN
ncbi:DUF1178 family protein [Roseicyclus amphidinii]|uniref:DUF1178 family protein n=1 Tax=Roseicyclus amphidinii TaxID=3034232 RepID=UPI0024E12D4E|nr:DUF1178 family protein [Roseicyclus sp. Amp-Y-6]